MKHPTIQEIRSFKPEKIIIDLPQTFSSPKVTLPSVEKVSLIAENSEKETEWPELKDPYDDNRFYDGVFV